MLLKRAFVENIVDKGLEIWFNISSNVIDIFGMLDIQRHLFSI